MDVNRHGLARHLEWGEVQHAFCSYRCEFFWRRTCTAEPYFAEAVPTSFSPPNR